MKIVRNHQKNHKQLSDAKDIYEYFTKEDNANVSINTVVGRGRFDGVEATSNFYYYVLQGTLNLEVLGGKTIELHEEDSIMLPKGSTYNMLGNYKVLMICEPAFGAVLS